MFNQILILSIFTLSLAILSSNPAPGGAGGGENLYDLFSINTFYARVCLLMVGNHAVSMRESLLKDFKIKYGYARMYSIDNATH